ncbi:cAMP-binding domain of CRP or a regulatory subunit of cAMP-dependent protein kinases [Peptostreptococcaceae bacterium pGA-8]|nr:cAMP-binding domain of CRP or a regulatory subunit of cAMP-dependent protein kinases [Peptostreptococcaceae bacterium pGA-8]
MEKISVLSGIGPESIKKMIPCFNPTTKAYSNKETIMEYSLDDLLKKSQMSLDSMSLSHPTLAILWEGTAKLEIINADGEIFLLESYKSVDVFGEIFSLPLDNFQYVITATSDCQISFIDYSHVVTPCENACMHHSQLISNLFIMSAQKSQELSLYVSIIGQPTIRAKLLTYLKYIKSTSSKKSSIFTIPMNLSQLSEYLHVDRSAMMREIKLLNNEGIIESERTSFRLL